MLLAGLFWVVRGGLSTAQAVPIGLGTIGLHAEKPSLAVTLSQAAVQVSPTATTRLRQDLSKRTRIPAATLKVVEATAKTWSDGCLGLAKADEICTEALVSGWRVVFSDGKQRWIYRSDKQARLFRLEP